MSGKALSITLRDVRKTKLAKLRKNVRCFLELDQYMAAIDPVSGDHDNRDNRATTATHLTKLIGGMKGRRVDVSISTFKTMSQQRR